MRTKSLSIVALLVVLSLLIATCGATPEPETIIQTVEVEVEKTVVETVEVEVKNRSSRRSKSRSKRPSSRRWSSR